MRLISLVLVATFSYSALAMHGGGYSPADWRVKYDFFQWQLRTIEHDLGEHLSAEVHVADTSIYMWDVIFYTGVLRHRLKAQVTTAAGSWRLNCVASEDERHNTLRVNTKDCTWKNVKGENAFGRPKLESTDATFTARPQG